MCLRHGFPVPVITTPSALVETTTTSTMSAGLIGGIIAIIVVAVAIVVVVVVVVIIKKKNAKKVDPRVIDKEPTDVEEKHRELDAVTPSVVKAEMSAKNGISHGKLTQVLGPEYTMSMSNATDEKKAETAIETVNEYHYMELSELESPHKLPPIETGQTPREALSPLDTQLQKPTLPAIK